MAKYRVYASIVGSKYLGEFEASSADEAVQRAAESDAGSISFCHQCSSECEDPEVDVEHSTAELVSAPRKKRTPAESSSS